MLVADEFAHVSSSIQSRCDVYATAQGTGCLLKSGDQLAEEILAEEKWPKKNVDHPTGEASGANEEKGHWLLVAREEKEEIEGEEERRWLDGRERLVKLSVEADAGGLPSPPLPKAEVGLHTQLHQPLSPIPPSPLVFSFYLLLLLTCY